MPTSKYSEITPEIQKLASYCVQNGTIDPTLYTKYDVKRGLRDLNGKGVVAGLTEVSEIVSNQVVGGKIGTLRGSAFLPRLQHRGPGPLLPPGKTVRL